MSWQRLVALFSFDWGKLLAEKVAEGSLEISAARQKVGLLDRANRDGFELLFAQFGVEVWDSAGEKAIEILFDIGELTRLSPTPFGETPRAS